MRHRPQKSRSDRPSPTPASFLSPIPGSWGVSVERLGIGKFQHLRLFGLWRGTGILAMFLLLATLAARGKRVGGWWRTAVEW